MGQAGAGKKGGRAENISCQPSLVAVIGSIVEDQAHYKETFFSYGKMYENLKGQAVC